MSGSLKIALLAVFFAQPLAAEVDTAAVHAKIGRYWNVASLDVDAQQSRIVLRVTFEADGKPTDFELIESEGPSQTGIDKLYESARRAVNRAYADGGLPLPADKYDTWRVLDLVFDANGMRQR